jgi:uncharacterized membrane protein YgdD (TMEM256/DUF423 family)
VRAALVMLGVFGFIGVAVGAFGAHALRERIPADRLTHLETGVRYLFFSLPGVLALGLLSSDCEGGLFEAIGLWSFAVGIVLFSGSLAVLAITGNRRWGVLTPVGGALLLVGWASVVVSILLTQAQAPSSTAFFSRLC